MNCVPRTTLHATYCLKKVQCIHNIFGLYPQIA